MKTLNVLMRTELEKQGAPLQHIRENTTKGSHANHKYLRHLIIKGHNLYCMNIHQPLYNIRKHHVIVINIEHLKPMALVSLVLA